MEPSLQPLDGYLLDGTIFTNHGTSLQPLDGYLLDGTISSTSRWLSVRWNHPRTSPFLYELYLQDKV